jgi:hypothetical protein
MEAAMSLPRGGISAMNAQERRVIVDRGFGATVDAVIDALLREGFIVEPYGAGDLRHRTAGASLRHAALEAWLPATTVAGHGGCAAMVPSPGCHVALYELVDRYTFVTVSWRAGDSSSEVTADSGLPGRILRALRRLTGATSSVVAA